ncbi:MAG: DinB family protein [Gemmatimonadota bacterium]
MSETGTTTARPLIPELEERRAEFEWARSEIQELVSGVTDAQLNWRPHEDEWSIAECVAHLNLIGRKMIPKIDAGIEKARAKEWLSDGPFRYGRLGNWLVRAGGADQLPPRRKMRAPKLYVPSPSETWLVSTTVPRFFALQEELIERVERANGIDLRKLRVPSAVLPLLRLSLGQWFALLAGHQRRHLWQARRVKKALGPDELTAQ